MKRMGNVLLLFFLTLASVCKDTSKPEALSPAEAVAVLAQRAADTPSAHYRAVLLLLREWQDRETSAKAHTALCCHLLQ